ncbi:MAG: hypothetical protein ACNS62_13220 [Candidatus Cyclobacteriaceae bacterium M3_2C_046]
MKELDSLIERKLAQIGRINSKEVALNLKNEFVLIGMTLSGMALKVNKSGPYYNHLSKLQQKIKLGLYQLQELVESF